VDLELYAWRRFAKALPLLAALLLVFCEPVRDWLTAELVERAMRRAAAVTGRMSDLRLPEPSSPGTTP